MQGSWIMLKIVNVINFLFTFLNVILFSSILFIYIFIELLSVTVSCFLMIYSKWSWIPDAEYNTSGNSNSSFHAGAGILNLLFLYYFYVFHV